MHCRGSARRPCGLSLRRRGEPDPPLWLPQRHASQGDAPTDQGRAGGSLDKCIVAELASATIVAAAREAGRVAALLEGFRGVTRD